METSYIYIITDGETYKVGISTDPAKRLDQLQTGSPKKLGIVETYKVPKEKVFKLEKECHKSLQYRFVKRGEWFMGATAFAVRLLVEEVCDRYIVLE